MQVLKKLFAITIILITFASGSGASYAAGVPVYQYTQSVGYASGSYWIGVSPYHTWRESTYYDLGEWGYTATSYYYYNWSSSSYVNSDYYITKITGKAAYSWAGANDNGSVYVQTSQDGVNWSAPSSIASLGNNGYLIIFSSPISPAKMVRVGILSMSTGNPNYIANTSLEITNFELSLAGADQGTVEAARTAANNASTYAQQARISADAASTNAANAFNAVSNANGNTITAVRDSSGTVLSEARQAKSEAQAANTKLDSIQTAVTNIQNNIRADISPPAVKIRTVSGAAATSAGSIQAYLDISDNVSSSFTYSLDGATYNAVPVNRVISLPVSVPGSNIIQVWIKDQAGNIGASSISIRKL